MLVAALLCLFITVSSTACAPGRVFESEGIMYSIDEERNAHVIGAEKAITEGVILSRIKGASVKYIDDHAFEDCSGMRSITIPDSVTFIGSTAFSECGELSTIIVPDSVVDIGADAFMRCSGLKEAKLSKKLSPMVSSIPSMGKEKR